MITVSPAERRREAEFAALLESGRLDPDHELAALVELAGSLRPVPVRPEAAFRDRLREQLVAEAGRRAELPGQRPVPGTDAAAPARLRIRRIAAGTCAAAVVAGAGTAFASTSALPGDRLYELKRGLESVELALARSDGSRGRELMEQSAERIREAERLSSSEGARDPRVVQQTGIALAEADAAAHAGASALLQAYADDGDVEALRTLGETAREQAAALADLIPQLAPSLRDEAALLASFLGSLQQGAQLLVDESADGDAPATALDGWAVTLLRQLRTQAETGDEGVVAVRGRIIAAPGVPAALTPGGGGGDPSGVAGILDGITGGTASGGSAGAPGGSGGPGPAPLPPTGGTTAGPLPTSPGAPPGTIPPVETSSPPVETSSPPVETSSPPVETSSPPVVDPPTSEVDPPTSEPPTSGETPSITEDPVGQVTDAVCELLPPGTAC
jgi:predicted secreted protein